MKKILLTLSLLFINILYSQLSLELISKDTIKHTTKNLTKSQGLNIDVYYPKFLKYAEGKDLILYSNYLTQKMNALILQF